MNLEHAICISTNDIPLYLCKFFTVQSPRNTQNLRYEYCETTNSVDHMTQLRSLINADQGVSISIDSIFSVHLCYKYSYEDYKITNQINYIYSYHLVSLVVLHTCMHAWSLLQLSRAVQSLVVVNMHMYGGCMEGFRRDSHLFVS